MKLKDNMKKQYRVKNSGLEEIIYTYHDGVPIKTWAIHRDNLDEEMDVLIEKGYTYGYTDDEIESARVWYENKLNNRLVEPKGE